MSKREYYWRIHDDWRWVHGSWSQGHPKSVAENGKLSIVALVGEEAWMTRVMYIYHRSVPPINKS